MESHFNWRMKVMNRETDLCYKLLTGRLNSERMRPKVKAILARRFPA